MARFRRSALALRPVVARKQFHQDAGNLVGGAQTILTIATCIQEGTALSAANQVRPSEKIGTRGRIYVSWFMYLDAASPAGSNNASLVVLKQGQVLGTDVPTAGNETTLATGMKQVLKTWKAIPGINGTGVPMGFAGWIKLPNKYRKFDEGDTLILTTNSIAAGKFCASTIYKVFS